MKLYQIAAEYNADVARLQDLDLPAEVVLDTIDGMQGDVSEKIKAVLIVAMQIDAEAEVRAGHAKRMSDSAKAMTNRADGLRSYAQVAIQNCGLALPLKYPEFNVNLQQNPLSCEVDDMAVLPALFKTAQISYTVAGDGVELKSLLDAVVATAKTKKAIVPSGIVQDGLTVIADKKAVLDALKIIAIENNKKPEGEAKDLLKGAYMRPVGFRITVK